MLVCAATPSPPDGGFSINGVPTPLRGVSRHQDRLYKGNALSIDDHYEDAQIIKEVGANTIRLAHYQHSQDFYTPATPSVLPFGPRFRSSACSNPARMPTHTAAAR